MTKREGVVLQSLRRVLGFLETHAAKVGPLATSSAVNTLKEVLEAVSSHATDQDALSIVGRGETRHKAALTRALVRDLMRRISAVALNHAVEIPNLEAFKLGQKVGVEQLIARARGMADAAQPYEGVLVANGLEADFLAKLRAAASAVEASVSRGSAATGARVNATTGIGTQLNRGRRAVRVLDALLVPVIGTDEPLKSEWRSAKRVAVLPSSGVVVVPAAPVKEQAA